MKLCSVVTIFLLQLLLFVVATASELPPQPVKTASASKSKRLKRIKPVIPNILPQQLSLSSAYYLNTCPDAEGIIQRKMRAWFLKDPTLAASILRLHFHDCAVRGCDASILLNHKGSERRALASRTLRGFQVVDDIKAELERQCPKTVSCADILTAAARDATVLIGGPFWEVPFGRKDGRISLAKEADMVPQGRENVTTLIEFFQERGLTLLDFVILSGSHTIGRSTCYSILHRLGKSDSTLDSQYLKNLTRQCKWSYDYVNLDVTTPTTFDVAYYTNLGKKKGLLSTDQALYSDPRTAPFVSAMATQPDLFFNQFAVSMVNLGNIVVPTRNSEVRANCNWVN